LATTISRNLKLRINSNLTADARFNLERIDALGAVFNLDNTETAIIRSKEDIVFRPQDASVGGLGTGGSVSFGISSQLLDSFSIYADEINFQGSLNLKDIATGGTRSLKLRYKSDVTGSTDTAADRQLDIDLEGADRQLVMGGNFSTAGGNLALTLTADSALTLPTSGTVSTLAGNESFTNKVIDADLNTLSNIANGAIKAGAGIVYGKLNLTGSIVNADVSSSAAIAGTKISPDFGSQDLLTTGQLQLSNGSYATSFVASGSQASNLSFILPASTPSGNQVLRANNSNPFQLEWGTVSGGGGGSVMKVAGNWLASDGTVKVFDHGLGTTDINLLIYDSTDNKIIDVDDIEITDSNNITLTASQAPSVSWRIIVQG